MNLNVAASVISASGTIVAAIALAFTYVQFRRLDQSIKGNTYQLTSNQAIDILKLLLEHPEIEYLDLPLGSGDPDRRRQAVFDRLLANYLDNVWGQMQLGLVSHELRRTYISLIDQVVTNNPAIAEQMMKPNFSQSLREHIASVLAAKAPKAAPESASGGGARAPERADRRQTR